MDKPVVHRRTINAEQLAVLDLLYRFRFGSNELFAQYFGKKGRAFVHKRLSILCERGLIGKRFDSSYRIQGKPAAYYLTPDGARLLQGRRGDDEPINVKAIYKDATVKDDFVVHCMAVFRLYNAFRLSYGDNIKFFTKAQLNYEKYDYFPKPLPAAFMRLKINNDEHYYFLEYFRDSEPFFAHAKRIQQYIDYESEAEWSVTEKDLPVLLIVCESESLRVRIAKRTQRLLDKSWSEELVVATCMFGELAGSAISPIWARAGDDVTDRLALADF